MPVLLSLQLLAVAHFQVWNFNKAWHMLSVTVKYLGLWLASPSSFSQSEENEVWGIYDQGENQGRVWRRIKCHRVLAASVMAWGRDLVVLPPYAHLKVSEEGGLTLLGSSSEESFRPGS